MVVFLTIAHKASTLFTATVLFQVKLRLCEYVLHSIHYVFHQPIHKPPLQKNCLKILGVSIFSLVCLVQDQCLTELASLLHLYQVWPVLKKYQEKAKG